MRHKDRTKEPLIRRKNRTKKPFLGRARHPEREEAGKRVCIMFAITIPQENIWNLQKYYAGSGISNISGMLVFDRKLDFRRLAEAINTFVKNQDGVRMRFTEKGGRVCQYEAAYEYIDIPVLSFGSMEEARDFLEDEGRKPFAMEDSPMYRFSIFDTPGQCGVFPCFNHMVSDAWTLSLFCRKVMEYYESPGYGAEPEGTASYLQYIRKEEEYRQSARYRKDAAYWEQRFRKKPSVSYIRPMSGEAASGEARRLTRVIGEDMAGRIKEWCAGNKVSPAVLFEAAVCAYLYRINGKPEETWIGTLVADRASRQEKEMAGMCVSTMPLGIRVAEEDTAVSLCEKIAAGHMELFRHQKYPYGNILKGVREKFGFSGSLFEVMVSYQNARIGYHGGIAYGTEWFSNGCSEAALALHIDDREERGCLTIHMDYQAEVFRDAEAELLYGRLYSILGQMAGKDGVTVGGMSIIPEEEYQEMIFGFNDTAVEYPKEKCIHELFMEKALLSPDRTALVFEGREFTYRQLDEMSNSLAHNLRATGVKPNDVVPIIARRSWHVIVAMLGILKAGGAFMSVDPVYPEERIGYMLRLSGAQVALTYGYGGETGIPCIALEDLDYSVAAGPLDNVNAADDLCYVIFTSGSTGEPKGIAICHRNLCNYCHCNDKNKWCKIIKPDDSRIVAVTNFVFDIFLTESIFSLLNGVVIYLTNDEEMISQSKLGRLVMEHGIDIIQTTPTKMRSYMFYKDNLEYLKFFKAIILGGEFLTEGLLAEIRKYTEAEIVNIYGPAEITVWSNFKKVEKEDITIGGPIANTQIYILDKDRKPLPVGIAGEVCISGDGVGKGYLNRPDLTAEKFIPNPFLEGKTMYCTGDLARWRADGELEFLGRMDTQVKIRGLRIELGEIESVMNTYEGIKLAAVAEQCGSNHRQYLAGYYISDRVVDEKALRRHLLAKLPAYMAPNYFMRLDRMPMTAGGKIDRKNLPVPELTGDMGKYEEPVTETEKVLAVIWERILQSGAVGRNTDFMECGGDSLSAMHMLAEVERQFGTRPDMKCFMGHTILSGLAAWIDGSEGRAEREIIPAGNRTEYVLTPQQKAIYLACRKEPSSLVYNMPMFIPLDEDMDVEKIKENFLHCYKRHPILRTRVTVKGDEIIGSIDGGAPLVFEEFEEKDAFPRPFDLSKAPLIRVGFGCEGMAVDIHHIAADGESLFMIMDEIFYGRKADEDISYADYAAYFYGRLAGGGFDRHREYFKRALQADIEPLELPGIAGKDLPQTSPEDFRKEPPGAFPENFTEGSSGTLPEDFHGKGEGTGYVYMLGKEAADRVRDFVKSGNLTETGVYLAMYGILMAEFANRQQIVTSIIVSNRIHAETRSVCGMFVNTIPLALDVRPELSFAEYADNVNRTLMEVYQYQELPFLEICRAAGIRDRNRLHTAFVYQPGERKAAGLRFEYIDTGTFKMDLSFQVAPQLDGCCKIMLEYNKRKYGRNLMERLAAGYGRLIGQMDGRRKLRDFSVMNEAEYRLVVYGFNQAALACGGYRERKQDIDGAEGKAGKMSACAGKTALVFRQLSFTYRQLDEMSNSLGHYLRGEGIRPNDIVPILAGRSWHAVAAMLGVLKAGGAYMPIDPAYPRERIAYMLAEAGSRVMLTYGVEGGWPVKCLDLDTFDYTADISPLDNVNVPEDICYVIFTSGSTGRPKGVLLKHAGLENFVGSRNVFHREVFRNCSRVLAIGSFAFDISVVEIFQPLFNGGCVVVADGEMVSRPDRMAGAIRDYGIDLLHTTPTRLGFYLENEAFRKAVSGLKAILLAGEVFPGELFRKIRKCTDADIFNGYGPTETTVGCSFVKVTDPGDISIGRPISNVRMYILDRNGKPCPVGVSGELCIAGAGVAKGYLNRPELTAEKFVPDPFVKGGRMYRSGDLARWRQDGEIEYLGRMDTQVKIRGLRIELGEIESVLASFDGVKSCAVTDGRDGKGRQYLAGYYTGERELEERSLRDYLAEKLPGYMVPNFLIRIDEMPLTVSGKTDRKRLPAPDPDMERSAYAAPRNGTEEMLCEIAGRILGERKVGIYDDFFELGGDSLSAMAYMAEAYEKGIIFDLQAVFEYPTAAGLCSYILQKEKAGSVAYDKKDFEKYREVLSVNRLEDVSGAPLGRVFGVEGNGSGVDENGCVGGGNGSVGKGNGSIGKGNGSIGNGSVGEGNGSVGEENGCGRDKPGKRQEGIPSGISWTDPGNVLLTGATGYLGAHILDSLMKHGKGKVYCLVREKGDVDGRASGSREQQTGAEDFGKGKPGDGHVGGRLARTLRYYFGNRYDKEMGSRIVTVAGDITDEGVTGCIPGDIQTVIHAAADVRHFGSYRRFHLVNVKGTEHMLCAARERKARFLLVSTVSVGGMCLAGEGSGEVPFRESDLYIGQDLGNVYLRSKFEAECLVLDARREGYPCTVFRVGNLTNRYVDGIFQPNYRENAFLSRMKVFLGLESLPSAIADDFLEFSPVDCTAEAIVRLAGYADRGYSVFHADNSKRMTYRQLAVMFGRAGRRVEVTDTEVFLQKLRGTAGSIYDSVKNEMKERDAMEGHARVVPDNAFTVRCLKEAGFEWPDITQEYVGWYRA